MQSFHIRLSKFHWYDQWHNHPRHQHAHWFGLFVFLLLTASFISVHVVYFYTERLEVQAASILKFSTYLGGSAFEHARDVAVDSAGNMYVVGGTESPNFPTTSGAYQRTHNPGTPEATSGGPLDVFVSKFSPTGNLIWSTFIGGPNYDRAYAVEVDSSGNVYVAGRAGKGFPTTSGVFQPGFQGGTQSPTYGNQDGFVAKLSSNGQNLLWSSYFGTSDGLIIRDIAVNSNGEVYLASARNSGSYVSSITSAFNNGPKGGDDAVVAKVSSDSSRVIWATYLGGSGTESHQNTIRVDGSGNPYILFTTDSPSLGSGSGFDKSYGGSNDLFVARLSPTNGNVVWGSYFGGSGNESTETHEMAVDSSGNIYVASPTTSQNMPASSGAFQRTYGGGGNDIFMGKLSSSGALLAGTYYGGSGNDRAEGVLADSSGVYFTGITTSTNFPVSANAYRATLVGAKDAIAVKLSPNLGQMYSSFFGGSGDDVGRGVAFSGTDIVFVGETSSSNFPKQNANDGSYGGNNDAFLAKLETTGGTTTPTPTSPPPSGPLPTANHPILFGYWHVDSNYGDFKNEISGYNNTVVIQQESFLRATLKDYKGLTDAINESYALGLKVIFFPSYTYTNAWDEGLSTVKPIWNKIDSIIVEDEPDWNKSQMESFISSFEAKLTAHSLPRKPLIVNFTPPQILGMDGFRASNLDIVSFEAYVDTSQQNSTTIAADLTNQIRQMKTRIGSSKNKMIVIQGYARNYCPSAPTLCWQNLNSLKSIQSVPYLEAATDPSVVGLHIFSYARPTGTRDLEQNYNGSCIKREHERIWGAISGTTQPASIACGTTGTPPTTTATPPPPPPPNTATNATPGWKAELAYNPSANNWLVVSQPARAGEIWGRIMDDDTGMPVTSVFQINTDQEISGNPKVAYSPDDGKYLVIYQQNVSPDSPTNPGKIYGRFISATGQLMGNIFNITSGLNGYANTGTHGALKYDSINKRFVLVWEHTSAQIIKMSFISSAGVVSPAINLSTTSESKAGASVVINEKSSEYCVIWSAEKVQDQQSVTMRQVSFKGTPGKESTVGVGGKISPDPSIAFNPDQNQYFVTWTSGVGQGTKGKFLTSCDGTSGSEFQVKGDVAQTTVDYNTQSKIFAVIGAVNNGVGEENEYLFVTSSGTVIPGRRVFTNFNTTGNINPVIRANSNNGKFAAVSSRDYAQVRFISGITPPITVTPTPSIVATPTPIIEACEPGVVQPGIPVICDFGPTIARPGDTINIKGGNLSGTVRLSSLAGTEFTIIGTADVTGANISFIIPANVAEGDYTLSVLGFDGVIRATSNQILHVTFDILSDVGATAEDTPFAQSAGINIPGSTTTFESLISNSLTYAVYALGIAVFIAILYAGFLWMTSAANPGNIASAKRYITNAIIGAVLLLSSYIILYTINPDLVGGTFNLPGIVQNTEGQSIRYIVNSESQSAEAFAAGCAGFINSGYQDFLAIECPGSMTLPLDIIITALDSNANMQIGATAIQLAGNMGQNSKVVILDSGYNYNHPDLISSYAGGWDFINNDNDPFDDYSLQHGSHVAGIITADGINGQAKGVAPQAQIVSGKVLAANGSGNFSNIVKAIYWAINGPDNIYGTADDFLPDAINLSVGVPGITYANFCDNNDATSRTMTQAIQYARNHGVVVVIAAGNNSGGVLMSGCIDSSFTVGAVDSTGTIAGFSGRGNGVDITAPGVNIYSTLSGSSYGNISGTSMATPVVSGIVALIKNAFPNYTVNQVENAIINTAVDLGTPGKDTLYGWGRISATAAGGTGSSGCTGVCGTLVASPASCTKGSIASNLNCNITFNYTSSGISPLVLVIKRGGVNVRTLTTANGTLIENNPAAGAYIYTLENTSTGAVLSRTTVYIYYAGTLISPWLTCTIGTDASNPNCNISLSYNLTGGIAGDISIYKDGVFWQTVSAPAGTVNDTNPPVGTHTYTLRDSSGNTQISRAVIRVESATPKPRVITSISPTSARIGDQITIIGTNLGNQREVSRGYLTVQIHNKNRVRNTTTGVLNTANTQGTWIVDTGSLPPGDYTLRVGPDLIPNNVSNEVNLTILP